MEITSLREMDVNLLTLSNDFNFPSTKTKIKDGDVDFKAVEKILGYKFQQPALVVEALTHSSYFSTKEKVCYERLEFLGDSVLNMVVSMDLFATYGDMKQDLYTLLRSTNVDNEKLARVALNHGLHKYLRHKLDLFSRQIDDFTREIDDFPLHSKGLIKVPKFLADIVESLIGAVFVDSNNFYKAYEVSKQLLKPMIGLDELSEHPMTKLAQFCQKRKRKMELKFVDTWEDNKTITVVINGYVVASATCDDRKEITTYRAAKAAMDKLNDDENFVQFLEKFQEEGSGPLKIDG